MPEMHVIILTAQCTYRDVVGEKQHLLKLKTLFNTVPLFNLKHVAQQTIYLSKSQSLILYLHQAIS